MTEPPTESPSSSRALLDRGRRTVLGHLGPMILHETNNVLTVMAGVRQLLRMGKDLPERVGPMIDSQMEKMEQMLSWMRTLGPQDPLEGAAAATLDSTARALESLLKLGAKGRRSDIRCRVLAEGRLGGAQAEAALLALLCLVLPLLPSRSASGRFQLQVDLGIDGERLEARCTLGPVEGGFLQEPDVKLAREIAASAQGSLACNRTEPSSALATLVLPRM